MSEFERIYVLGAGAVGLPLAASLVRQGRPVTAVRTSTGRIPEQTVEITIRGGTDAPTKTPVEMISLSSLERLDGIVVITAKSYANKEIAYRLGEKRIASPIVVMQNGIGVETPFIDAKVHEIYRCVLYVTSQKEGHHKFAFRAIAASPIGIINGNEKRLRRIVEALDTVEFPLCAHEDIQKEIWKKAIINSVFNSICPLLEADNGVFQRDERSAEMAREIVAECLQVANRLGLGLKEHEIMEQIFMISSRSDGQLISTLQDIRNGRETEIESLNLAIGRVAENLKPPVILNQTILLGRLIQLKSRMHATSKQKSATKQNLTTE